LPFLALALDAPPPAFVFDTVVVVLVVVGVVGVVLLALLLVVVVVVLVTFAFPFVLSVVHPFRKAATASRAKRAKVLRIEFSPITHRVER
jgi:fatty acid desaturase